MSESRAFFHTQHSEPHIPVRSARLWSSPPTLSSNPAPPGTGIRRGTPLWSDYPVSPAEKGRWLEAPWLCCSSGPGSLCWAAVPCLEGAACTRRMPDGIPRRPGSCSCPQFHVNSLVPLPFPIPVSLCRLAGKTSSHS